MLAAIALEPVVRAEKNDKSLLRVLEVRARFGETSEARLSALDEGASIAEAQSLPNLLDLLGRGLGEAYASQATIEPWLERIHRISGPEDAGKRAAVFERVVGDAPVDNERIARITRLAAVARQESGEIKLAIALYQRVLAFSSTTEILRTLEQLYSEQENFGAKRTLFGGAPIRAETSGAKTPPSCAWHRGMEGATRLDTALETFRAILGEDADDDSARQAVLDLLAALGRHEERVTELERYTEHATEHTMLPLRRDLLQCLHRRTIFRTRPPPRASIARITSGHFARLARSSRVRTSSRQPRALHPRPSRDAEGAH